MYLGFLANYLHCMQIVFEVITPTIYQLLLANCLKCPFHWLWLFSGHFMTSWTPFWVIRIDPIWMSLFLLNTNNTHTHTQFNNPGRVYVFIYMCWEGGRGAGVNVRGWYPCAVMSGQAADTAMIIQGQLDLEQHHEKRHTHTHTPLSLREVWNGANGSLDNITRPDGTMQHVHLFTQPVGRQKPAVPDMNSTLVFRHQDRTRCHYESRERSIKQGSLCEAR